MGKAKTRNDTLSKLYTKNIDDLVLEYEPHDYRVNYDGFIKLVDKLVNFTELNLSDRLVYSALRNYASNEQYNMKTNVTNETVANRLGIGKTTVSKSISRLQELGIIKLYKSNSNQRIIKIVRDFYVEQPEESEYKKKHPKQTNRHLESDEDFDDFPF